MNNALFDEFYFYNNNPKYYKNKIRNEIIKEIKNSWLKKDINWFINYVNNTITDIKSLDNIGILLKRYDLVMDENMLSLVLKNSIKLATILKDFFTNKSYRIEDIERISNEFNDDILFSYASLNELIVEEISDDLKVSDDLVKSYLNDIDNLPKYTEEEK